MAISGKKQTSKIGSKKATSKQSKIGKPSSSLGGSTAAAMSLSKSALSQNPSQLTSTKSKIAVQPSKTALKDSLVKLQQKNTQDVPPTTSKPATYNIANIKPGTETHTKEGANRRQEVLRQLREKLGDNLSTVEKSTKTGRGAVAPTVQADNSAQSMNAAFTALSMSQIETRIQSFSLRFVDLIICCMVIDNYLFGALILFAAIAEIIIGWLYIEQCTSEATLPYVLMVNGVLNIIAVHMRNLANQRLIDYFVMSVFRLMSFFSFVYLIIVMLTIDPSMTIWFLPKDAVYVSNKGIVYCSKVLYYFTYYLIIIAVSLTVGLSLYTIVCIGYMQYQLGGRRIHGSRISSAGPSSTSSKGSRSGNTTLSASKSKLAKKSRK